MPQLTQPLKNNWKIDEDKGFVADQIKERVDSESNYDNCKGYFLTEEKGWTSPLYPKIKEKKNENV